MTLYGILKYIFYEFLHETVEPSILYQANLNPHFYVNTRSIYPYYYIFFQPSNATQYIDRIGFRTF